jgi:colanic acid biosynthesis protein WcaH
MPNLGILADMPETPRPRHYLPHDTLLSVVRHTPLVSIDLVCRNARGEVLLGLRQNRPAQGTWFVPGGRILKDERVADALRRIAAAELGFQPDEVAAARPLGVFEHLYPDNFSGTEDVTTHYVVLAYAVTVGEDSVRALDSQHSALRWLPVDELLASAEVHVNTRAYFDDRITSTHTP